MKNNPLISVVIPNYNNEYFLKDALNSVIKQTYKNIEILIYDDSSSDNSLNIIKKIAKNEPRIKLYKGDKNKGIVHALNNLIKISKGQYIARFDADDIMVKNRLEVQLKYLETHNLDLVGTSVFSINEDNEITGSNYYPSNPKIVKLISNFASPILHIWLCKKELYDTVGLYRFSGAEDYDFLLRCLAQKYRISNVKNYYGMYIRHRNGNTQSTIGAKQRRLFNFINKKYSNPKYNNQLTFNYTKNNIDYIYDYCCKILRKTSKRQYLNITFKFISFIISPLHTQYYIRRILEKIFCKFDILLGD